MQAITVLPANSSRLFATNVEALNQPLGNMHLVIREQQNGDGNGKSINIENREFNHLLTQHDFHYCTDSPSTLDASHRIITSEIRKFSNAESKKLHIVDIGC